MNINASTNQGVMERIVRPEVDTSAITLDQAVDSLIVQHGIEAVRGCFRRKFTFTNGSKSGTESGFSSDTSFHGASSDSSDLLEMPEDFSQSSTLRHMATKIQRKARRTIRKNRELLRKSERLNRAVLDSSFDAIFCINQDGIILLVNEAASTQFGWSKDELQGQNISVIVGTKHSKNHDEYLRRYLQSGEKRVMGKKRELPARRKDGSEFPIELGLTEIKTQEGEERMFCGFVKDITEKKQFEAELIRKNELSNAILEAASHPMFSITETGTILMANEAAFSTFGWDSDELLGQNISKIVGGGHAEHHNAYLHRYLKTGEKRVMGKKRELSARRKDGSEFPIELGLSEVRVHGGEERVFCGFIRDLTEERALQQELKEEHAMTLGIIDASFDAMFAIDEHGIIKLVNEASCKQFGWSKEEFLGQNIKMIVEPKHAGDHDNYLKQYMKTGTKKMIGKRREVNGKRKDGSVFPLNLGLAEIGTSGKSHIFVAFIQDLTNQKQFEQDLQEKNAITTGIIEASFDAMFAIDKNGVIQMVNEASCKQFGWTREEFLGQNIKMIVEPKHAGDHDNYLKQYMKTGTKKMIGKQRQVKGKRKDGSIFPLNLGLAEIGTEGKSHTFVAFIQDLTSQKQFEQDMQEKNALTTGIIEASFDAMFAIDENGIIRMVNEASCKQFGWSREEFLGQNIKMIVEPKHASGHDNYLKEYLKTGIKKMIGKQREVKGKRKDGSIFPLNLGLSEIGTSGKSHMFVAFIQDLTNQKQFEQDLQEKNALTTGIIEASFDAMFAIDENGIIRMVNEASCKQFGWTRDELLGQNIKMIVEPKHATDHDNYLKQYMKTGIKKMIGKQREVRGKRKDGTIFPLNLGLSEIGTTGKSHIFVAFIQDLTNQKQFEQDLKEKNALTTGIIEASFDAMFAIDENGIIRMVNEASCKQFGWAREEFLGQNIKMIVEPKHATDHDNYLKQYMKTGIKKMIGKQREVKGKRKDGSVFPLNLGLSEIGTNGKSHIFVAFIQDLTNQKQFEEDLQEKNTITTGIIEASFDAMFAIDKDGIIQMVNEASCKQFGWSREELLGKNIKMIVEPKHARNHDDYLKQYMKTGMKKMIGKRREVKGKRKDGSIFPLNLGLAEIGTRGKSHIFVAFIQDLTSQKQYEQDLQEKNAITTGIIEASFDAMFAIDKDGIIQVVNEASCKQFGWSREEFMGKNIKMIVEPKHAGNHDDYLKQYMKTGMKKMIGKRREVKGMRKDGSIFPLNLGLAEIGTRGKSQIFVAFIQDLTSQKQFEQDLQEKNTITTGIIEASFDAMFAIDKEGIIRMVNEASCKQFGWSREEFLGQNIKMIVEPKHAGNHDDYLKQYMKTGMKKMIGKRREVKGKRKDGSIFPLNLGLAEIGTSGKSHIFVAFIQDLTSQKQYEQDLQEKNAITSGIIEASFDAMFAIDKDGIIQIVNEASCKQFGWSREEFLGQNIKMIVEPKHEGNHDDYLKQYMKTGMKKMIGKRREVKGKRKDGSIFPLNLGLAEIGTSGKSHIFVAFIQDLTSQKQYEQDLKEKNALTTGIIEASFDAMFAIDKDGIIQVVNEASCQQFGWSREEFIGQNIKMIVEPKHAGNHDDYLKQYMKTGMKKMIGKRREVKGKRKDGSIFPLNLGLAEIGTSGKSHIFVAFIQDLTSQKQYEQDLKEKNALTTGIIEASFDAMFAIDKEGVIQVVNEASCRQFGWSREEFIGQNIKMIVEPKHAGSHDDYLKQYMETGMKKMIGKRREVNGRRKDGSIFPLNLGLAEIGTSGKSHIFVAFIQDLTSQKQYEQDLKQKNAITTGIIEASFDAMFAINKEGIIQMVNEASCRKFGWSRDEFLGKNINMVVGGGHSTKHDSYLKCYLSTGERKMIGKQREVRGRRKDESSFPLMLGLSEIAAEGKDQMFVAFLRDLTDEKRLRKMEIAKAEAESLLLNMLPEEIALRLIDDPSHIADHHPRTTILFADIVGFTKMSSMMSPVELVKMLNALFSGFDRLVDKYNLNKVKTIGDCYMVTSVPDSKHPGIGCSHVCHFAFEMLDQIEIFNEEHPPHELSLRVGINTGPVVAGVVGTKRFMYDLWGDAVNLASRMESTGIAGRIQVTKDVVETLPEGQFLAEARGVVQVKGKGEIYTYFLTERIKQADFSKSRRKLPVRVLRRDSTPDGLNSSKDLASAGEGLERQGAVRSLKQLLSSTSEEKSD